MCGEHATYKRQEYPTEGSSPHVRGAHREHRQGRDRPGIIPACAGSTGAPTRPTSATGDHPRMCGEHTYLCPTRFIAWGSSPHVRGAPHVDATHGVGRGIIPACAGSTLTRRDAIFSARDHPRMCGEHRLEPSVGDHGLGSSPHVRGAHFENSIIPRKRKDNWLFFIQFRFENFLAFRYLLALLHPFLGVPTKDPSFASLGRLINCNPSQSTGDQSAPYTLKAICCSFLAE